MQRMVYVFDKSRTTQQSTAMKSLAMHTADIKCTINRLHAVIVALLLTTISNFTIHFAAEEPFGNCMYMSDECICSNKLRRCYCLNVYILETKTVCPNEMTRCVWFDVFGVLPTRSLSYAASATIRVLCVSCCRSMHNTVHVHVHIRFLPTCMWIRRNFECVWVMFWFRFRRGSDERELVNYIYVLYYLNLVIATGILCRMRIESCWF